MKRIAGTCLVLAALGGCNSMDHSWSSRLEPVPNSQAHAAVGPPGYPNPALRPIPYQNYACGPAPKYYPSVGYPAAPAAPVAPPAPVAQPASVVQTIPVMPATAPAVSTQASSPAEAPSVWPVVSNVSLNNGGSYPAQVEAASTERLVPEPVTRASYVAPAAVAASNPAIRLVNSKRVSLNYELKDVGPSGVSTVELWFTQDGRNWQKYEGSQQNRSPFVVEMKQEGLYGFSLVARSGVGLSKRPPKPGEPPQALVEVDQTKPVVQLMGIEAAATPEGSALTIHWKANDKNLAPRGIALSYAKQAGGPWVPIATNLENTGRYVWKNPTGIPPRFLVRVEASDLVDNVGVAQTANPVFLDLSEPTAAIVAVGPAEGPQLGSWVPENKSALASQPR